MFIYLNGLHFLSSLRIQYEIVLANATPSQMYIAGVYVLE